MKANIESAVLLLLAIGLSACRPGVAGGGCLYDEGGLTVVDLHGSWHQMGVQYGGLVKDLLEDELEYIDRRLGEDSLRVAAAAGIADSLYANYPVYLKSFFDGAAESSGLSLEQLKMCNAVEYIEGEFLCSAFAAGEGYAKDKLVFGRNYDAASYSEIDRDIVLTVYHPDGGIAAATVGYAGEIYCVNGFNAEGIFIELNNGMPSAGYGVHWELCPSTTGLFEMLFKAGSLDDVDDFFKSTSSSISVTIGVADKHEARSYEWCYDGVRRGDGMTDKGLMVSTNHYVNDGWGFPIPGDAESWNSITRRSNLLDMAERHKGSIDVEMMKEIMSTSIEDGGPAHFLTRYQIVAVPEDMSLNIFVPCVGDWVEVDLEEYFKIR